MWMNNGQKDDQRDTIGAEILSVGNKNYYGTQMVEKRT